MPLPPYLCVTLAYALLGLLLGLAWRSSRLVRERAEYQLLLLLASLLASAGAAAASPEPVGFLAEFHFGLHGLVFLAAALCHAPLWVAVALSLWDGVLERLLLASRSGAETGRRRRPRSRRELWRETRQALRALSRNPLDPRRREELGQLLLELGCLDAAIRECRKAIECTDRGYDQARLMYKTCRLLVERRDDVPAAASLLRRLVRLYPKSYFAAYARRVLNGYEARQSTQPGRGAGGTLGPE